MLYSVLAVGDVVGESGLAHLERHLRPLQKLKNISFTVVNGENISATGLTRKQALRVYDAGADARNAGEPYLRQNGNLSAAGRGPLAPAPR